MKVLESKLLPLKLYILSFFHESSFEAFAVKALGFLILSFEALNLNFQYINIENKTIWSEKRNFWLN